MIDLWDDNNEPIVRFNQAVYYVGLPSEVQMTMPTNEIPYVYVGVDKYGLVELVNFNWFGQYSRNVDSTKQGGIRREIYQWLEEWEIIESRRIGPEDSEWFATKKLLDLDIQFQM